MDAAHRGVDHGFGRLGQTLIFPAQVPRQTQPREGSLHCPPTRQDLKAVRLILELVALQLPDTMVGYLYSSPSLLFGPLAEPAGVRTVRPHHPQPRQP